MCRIPESIFSLIRIVLPLCVFALVAGCRDSESEVVKTPGSEPATVNLPRTPTRIPIRPLVPPDPRPRLIATIQSRGGKVTVDKLGVESIDWHRAPIHNLDLELLTEVPEVRRLYLSGVKVDSRGFQYLASLPNLERLALWRTPIRDDDLQFLAGAKKLKILDLSQTGLTGEGLAHLADCESLESLILSNTYIEKQAITHIAKIRSLREVDVRGTGINTGLAIGPLKALPKLEEVKLEYCDAEVLRQLAGFPNIRRLDLSRGFRQEVTAAISELSKMQRLEIVHYANFDNQNEFLEHVSKCPNLREIRMFPHRRNRAHFTDAGLAHLNGHPSLRLLDVREASPAIAGLRKIAQANPDVTILVSPIRLHGLQDAFRSMGLGAVHSRDGGPRLVLDREMNITAVRLEDARVIPESLKLIGQAIYAEKIEHLSLGHMNLTDQALANFPAGVDLKVLNLQGTQITPAGIKAWGGGQYPELPFLESLDLSGTTLDDDCLAWIGTLDRLKTLNLAGVSGVSKDGWMSLQSLSDLEELDCSRTNWDDETLAVLQSLPELRILQLTDTAIKGEGLPLLKGCPKLQSLDLSGVQAGPKDLTPLTELPELERLAIGDCTLGDAALLILAKCKNLRYLSLRKTSLEGKALGSLDSIPNLAALDISENELSPESYQQIANLKNLRRLNLAGTGIGDEAIPHLAGLERLEWLSLRAAKITDQNLPALASLNKLEELDLGQTAITGQSLIELSRLPALRIMNLGGTNAASRFVQALHRTRPEIQLHTMPVW